MNILIIIDTPGRGGAERVSFTLARWFGTHDDIHATIVALNESKKSSYPTEGIDYINLNSKNLIWGIRKIAKQKKANIVLTMTVPLCIYTVPALLGLNIKHVLSERNSPAHFAGKWTTKVLSRWLMRLADGFVFQTKQARDYYGGRIAEKSTVIHNPICEMSEDLFKSVFERNKVIVSIGRLNKQKNQAMLIKAFAVVLKENPEYTLIIYGDGREKDNLTSLINTLGISGKVILAGTQSDVHKEIADAAMFVMSSDFEGMPNALMEAMSLGIPCISTDCPCGGPAELIVNGKNGILVPVGNIEAMTNAMKSILSDHKYAELIGREASHIKETHSADLICKKWLDYFSSIICD